jgi:glycosyl transferase, family 25
MENQENANPNHGQWFTAFGRVRIVSLASRTDRRNETIQEFARHGWRIPDSQVRFFDAVAPQEAGGFPSIGARGCFMSHLNILREAWQEGASSVLILEDDVAFTRDMGQLAPQAVESLQAQEWDIAYLGHDYGDHPGTLSWVRIEQPRQQAHCYAVNGRILPTLVEFLEQILQRPPGHPDGGPMHFDGALGTFIRRHPEVRALHCSRNLAYQRPSRTDIHQTSALDRHAWFAPLKQLYRAIKRLYWRWIR